MALNTAMLSTNNTNALIGFININKPKGCTSHDVVSIIRKKTGIKKVGHAGTLDPFATGVLLIGLNNATRLFEFLPSDKKYIAEIIFGLATDTDDITGQVTNETQFIPTLDQIKNQIKLFTGKHKQKPPVYSAIKINGERAYKLARKKELDLKEIKEKNIEIYSIEIISLTNNKLTIRVHCSSGTYIRSLARDLGLSVSSLATLSSLQRISIGKVNIEESLELTRVDPLVISKNLIKPEKILDMCQLQLSDNEINDIQHGRSIKIHGKYQHKTLQLIDKNDRLIAIGEILKGEILKPKKVFNNG